MAEALEDAESGYFRISDRPKSPSSIHSSDSMSIHSSQPSAMAASLTALQYLPIPLLVLSSAKSVVIANEAMGRLLGIDFESTAYHDFSITEVLQDKTMSELGIDILQNGSPLLVSWEVRGNVRRCIYMIANMMQRTSWTVCMTTPRGAVWMRKKTNWRVATLPLLRPK